MRDNKKKNCMNKLYWWPHQFSNNLIQIKFIVSISNGYKIVYTMIFLFVFVLPFAFLIWIILNDAKEGKKTCCGTRGVRVNEYESIFYERNFTEIVNYTNNCVNYVVFT